MGAYQHGPLHTSRLVIVSADCSLRGCEGYKPGAVPLLHGVPACCFTGLFECFFYGEVDSRRAIPNGIRSLEMIHSGSDIKNESDVRDYGCKFGRVGVIPLM